MKGQEKAHYEPGTTVWLKQVAVDESGGLWNIEDVGPLDVSVTLSVPAHAVSQETSVSVGYDNGHLHLRAGKESGLVLALKAAARVFKEPVTVTIGGLVVEKGSVPIVYAIEETGDLSPMFMTVEKETGALKVYTWRPIMMTVVYAHL